MGEQEAIIQQINKLLKDKGISLDDLKENQKEKTWKDKLKTTKYGYDNNIGNYKLWLENDSKYTGKLKYNEFFDYIEYDGTILKDQEENFMLEAAESYFDHKVSKERVNIAFKNYAYENSYNPIIEYLDSLKQKWDGTKRIETLLVKCLDADDTELTRFFTKTWMVAAVKRAYQPGCQFDCVLSLQGGIQGNGKSTLIQRLALDKYYMTFAKGEFSSKDSIDKMNQSWITFLDEFDKFSEAEVADLKCKITQKVMACRKSYGHNTQKYNVHWVYAAATNADDFLCDLSGDGYERRYWIVECKKTTIDSRVSDIMTDDYVNQLWAEAVTYYFDDPNQKLYLDSSNPLLNTYKEYQIKFKKTAKNIILTYLSEILNKRYKTDDKGCFTDTLDMYNQFTGVVTFNGDLFVEEKNITKVPCAYITHILSKVYNKQCTPKIIKSCLIQLGDEWELKATYRYKGRVESNVLVRRCD